jgi:hypothetical protein
MGLSLMNMLGLSSSVRIAHRVCYRNFFLLQYIQVLWQYRPCKADHAKVKVYYDRRSVAQSTLVSSTHLGFTTRFLLQQTVAGLLMWGALSDKRTGLPFTIAAGPRQRSHSWLWVPRDSWPYFTVSDSRLPQPGGPGPHIYISPRLCLCSLSLYNPSARTAQKTAFIVACIGFRENMMTQLIHSNGRTRHISFRDNSSTVVCRHYIATAVPVAPQFLLSANTPQYLA